MGNKEKKENPSKRLTMINGAPVPDNNPSLTAAFPEVDPVPDVYVFYVLVYGPGALLAFAAI